MFSDYISSLVSATWMDLRRGRARGGSVSKVALLFCACLCFFIVCALVSGTSSGRATVGEQDLIFVTNPFILELEDLLS